MLLFKTEYGNALQYLFTAYRDVFQENCCCNPVVSLYKKNIFFLKNAVFRVKFKHTLYLFSNKVSSLHLLQKKL